MLPRPKKKLVRKEKNSTPQTGNKWEKRKKNVKTSPKTKKKTLEQKNQEEGMKIKNKNKVLAHYISFVFSVVFKLSGSCPIEFNYVKKRKSGRYIAQMIKSNFFHSVYLFPGSRW